MLTPTASPQTTQNPAADQVAGIMRQLRLWAVCTAVLVACFIKPLYALAELALNSGLYSHILLIPFISAYLCWTKKCEMQSADGSVVTRRERAPAVRAAALFLALGLVSIGSFFFLRPRLHLAPIDSIAWTCFSFFLLFVAVSCFSLARPVLRSFAFPIGFVVFIVPFPEAIRAAIEAFLQHASADAAALFFSLAGTPYVRQDVAFQLPGFSLAVAPECSGIRSSLVLFITSLIAGQLFLRSNWKRALFSVVVIPLGILRNGFRIVTIGELCVHIDPSFIDSPIHKRGGPVFFVISLVPFLLLLWYLHKTDSPKHQAQNATKTFPGPMQSDEH